MQSNFKYLNNDKVSKSGDEMTGILRLYSGGTSTTKSNITFSKYQTGTKILQQGNDSGDFTLTLPGETGTLSTQEFVKTYWKERVKFNSGSVNLPAGSWTTSTFGVSLAAGNWFIYCWGQFDTTNALQGVRVIASGSAFAQNLVNNTMSQSLVVSTSVRIATGAAFTAQVSAYSGTSKQPVCGVFAIKMED